jgi:alpha-2-macroglobulin
MNLISLLILSQLAPTTNFYRAADVGQRANGSKILPESFLRGFDPVTVYYSDDQVAARANADDGASRMKLVPSWPGQYFWVDRRTLQFRPAEPWPALARFQIEGGGTNKVLSTMMAAPTSMIPTNGSEALKPFRVITLTFPQSYSLKELKKMVSLEVRELPGLAGASSKKIANFALAPLPRSTNKEPAGYTVTLENEIEEGQLLLVNVSLNLGQEVGSVWQGRAATRSAFSLLEVRCGVSNFPLIGGASTPKELALNCGNTGEMPQLIFSGPVGPLSLSALRQLVRFEPAVNDLHFTTYGNRVQLAGRFVPDTLYTMRLASSASSQNSREQVLDEAGRTLKTVAPAQIYFHLGTKAPFLQMTSSNAIVEANGPKMIPLRGYGENKADIRIHRIDALHTGLWPFPSSPIVIDEDSSPPFPGDEPEVAPVGSGANAVHIRLLGSPLVSRVVDLPLQDRAGALTFGLDLRPLLDSAVGARQPGTYLVGLRRLKTGTQRSWMRVQVTNLSITTVEESGRVVFFVRSLDTAAPVAGASIRLDGECCRESETKPSTLTLTTDGEGRAVLQPMKWSSLLRVSVTKGDDTLVFDPNERLPAFAYNHWSGSNWLRWLLTDELRDNVNDTNMGFVFTERAIYRPGESVFIKAYARFKKQGQLTIPSALKTYSMQVVAPDGNTVPLEVKYSNLGGLEATFAPTNPATGDYTVRLFQDTPENIIATRYFKIEAYRVPTFEVLVNGPSRVRNDAPFQVKALARYFAGGNLTNQPIKWTVTQSAFDWTPKNMKGFLFASSTQMSRSTSQKNPPQTDEEGELDDKGQASITANPQRDLDGSPKLFRFEATVTGPDEQPVTAYTEVKALPSFVVGLKVPRFLEKTTSLKAEVVAIGVDDKPIKGQELRVRLFRRVWHSNLRESSFASGQAKYATEQEDIQLVEKTVTSTEAAMPLEFQIAESGVHVVEVFARDKLGRVQTLSADLFIGGQNAQAWQKSREGVFELKPDKATYAPGEIAHIVVQSPYEKAQGLVVIEEPKGNKYSFISISGSQAVIDVNVTEASVPNLPMHVVLMRGRTGETKINDERYKPSTVAASLDLRVTPEKNTVNVSLKHVESARPGTTQNFTVSLTDDKQRPVSGEVTLWLVDEAVLSLASEGSLDPLTEMLRNNQRTINISDSRNLVLGALSELEETPGGDGSDGDQSGKKIVRKNFKTVPYYKATLVVDSSGTITVPIQLSDDLTNFKVRAVAASGATRFGFKQSQLKVRLPVLVQPQLPRFVRLGDTFIAGGLARMTEGPEGAGTVSISVSGPVSNSGPTKKAIALKNNLVVPIAQEVKVNFGTGLQALKVSVDVERTSDKASDAFEISLPVLPDTQIEKFGYFASLVAGKNSLKEFKEKPREGTAQQTLVMSNQRGLLQLAASLDYLSAYPHGCLEQRMSQVSPDLALGGFLKKLELETRFTPQIQNSTKRLLDEVKAHQDDKGFVSYWPGGTGDVALTAQAVEFMALAKSAGIVVDAAVQKSSVNALKTVLRNDFKGFISEYRYNQQSAAFRALARVGVLEDNYLVEAFNRRETYDAVSLADLAFTMGDKPGAFAPNITALKSDLWDRVQFQVSNGQTVFQKIRGERVSWGSGYLGSPVSTTAAVWEALLKLDPSNADHSKLRDALLSQSNATTGFGTTHDNRRAISALGRWLTIPAMGIGETTLSATGMTPVTLNGDKKAAKRMLTTLTSPVIELKGAPTEVRVLQSYLPAQSGSVLGPLKSGLLVSRTLTRYPLDGSAPVQVTDAPGAVVPVTVGEVLEIHASLTLDVTRNHVALVIPFAAGLESLNPALANASSDAKPSMSDSVTPTYVERLDSEVRYYFTDLSAGTHTFHFRVRAANVGKFVHPPPVAELMYREEIRGRGAGLSIEVKGK